MAEFAVFFFVTGILAFAVGYTIEVLGNHRDRHPKIESAYSKLPWWTKAGDELHYKIMYGSVAAMIGYQLIFGWF